MKIFIVGPSWIGDMVMSQMLYRALIKQYPNAIIDVMAPSWCLSLLSRMPEVNNSIMSPFRHGEIEIKKRFMVGKNLKRKHYDRAYILPNSFKSALIPFFADIPHRIGWRGEMRYGLINDIRILDEKIWPLMGERYLALAYKQNAIKSSKNLLSKSSSFWPQLQVLEKEKLQTYSTFNLLSKRQVIGFCPGAESSLLKCWPHYHYSELAKQLINEGYQILLFGSKKDCEISNKIYFSLNLKEQNFCFNLAGKTKLDQVVILLSSCRAVVSNDSGLMHISAALKKPMVALYGPSNPDFTPPLSKEAHVIFLKKNNFHKLSKFFDKQNYHQSLINISPKYVLNTLKNLLNKTEKH